MAEFEIISPNMLKQYRDRSGMLIIDLRSKEEYAQDHIMGAINIPYEDKETLFSLSRSKTIILYCERGAASLIRSKEMASKGYRVKSLAGGMHAYRKGRMG